MQMLSIQQVLHGPDSPQAAAAEAACLSVLRDRYGPLSAAALATLLQGAAYGLSRVDV